MEARWTLVQSWRHHAMPQPDVPVRAAAPSTGLAGVCRIVLFEAERQGSRRHGKHTNVGESYRCRGCCSCRRDLEIMYAR